MPDPAPKNTVLSEPPREHAITGRRISFHFGAGETRTPVLFDNSFDIGKGEIVLMTGPSGSGKTTLLTLIGGLRQLQEGRLEVLGSELAGASQTRLGDLRRQVGFIFQHHNLFGSLSALENVQLAGGLHGGDPREIRDRCSAMLGRLGLGDRLRNLPSRLSGGQRQRVAIARALVNRPSLVLADEPTAALDPESGAGVFDLFRELADGDARTTVLIVTHDQRLIDRADRIINMVAGRIISNVRPEESIRICKALLNCPDLKGMRIGEGTLAKLAERMRVEHRRPGEVIVREGTTGREYYVLGAGAAEASLAGEVQRQLGVNDGFGELTGLSAVPVPFTVRSLAYVELFVLEEEDCRFVLERDEGFEEQLRRYYMNRQ